MSKPNANATTHKSNEEQEMSDNKRKSSTEVLAEGRGEVSVFETMRKKAFPYRYRVTLLMSSLVGGVPSDPKVAEGWIRTKLADDRDDLIREVVATSLVERGMANEDGELDADIVDKAVADAANLKHLNGFKRTENGELYIEGRQVKAMVKENANIKWPKDRWGVSKKGTRSYFAEHVFVEEDVIPLGIKETVNADGSKEVSDPRFSIQQRFVHTWRGNGIQLEEMVEDVEVTFHIVTDHEFKEEQWGLLFLSAEQNGLGAARSQGFGRFATVEFEPVKHPKRTA